MLIVIFKFLLFFNRKIKVVDLIFNTFNCRIFELIKVRTLNFTSNE